MEKTTKIHFIYIILIIVGYFLLTKIINPSEDVSEYEKEISVREERIKSLEEEIDKLDALLSITDDSIMSLKNDIAEAERALDEIPNKYDEERGFILGMSNDESVKYLSNRLNTRVP